MNQLNKEVLKYYDFNSIFLQMFSPYDFTDSGKILTKQCKLGQYICSVLNKV